MSTDDNRTMTAEEFKARIQQHAKDMEAVALLKGVESLDQKIPPYRYNKLFRATFRNRLGLVTRGY